MPSYRQVAQLTIASLVDESDRPEIAEENESLQDVAAKLGTERGARPVVVVDAAQKAVGIISPADVTAAIGQGITLQSPAKELTQRKPPVVTVPDTSLLEQVPSLVGPFSMVVVTDQQGRPTAALDREDLANRIKSRFLTAS